MNFVEIVRLRHIAHFKSLPDHTYGARRISDGLQEIEVTTGGEGVLVCNGVDYPVQPGDLFWLHPGDEVWAKTGTANPYQAVVFSFAVARPPDRKPPLHALWANREEGIRFSLQALNRYRCGKLTDAFIECTYARLFWEAITAAENSAEAPPPALEQAIAYIENHLIEPLCVAEVAEQVRISASHLHLLFREGIGESPMQLVKRLRLLKAESLLCNTRLSVKEISRECGFDAVNHFCYSFRKAKQISPGTFRKDHRIETSDNSFPYQT